MLCQNEADVAAALRAWEQHGKDGEGGGSAGGFRDFLGMKGRGDLAECANGRSAVSFEALGTWNKSLENPPLHHYRLK